MKVIFSRLVVAMLVFSMALFTMAQEGEHGANFSGELSIAVWGQIDIDDSNRASFAFHQVLQQWNDLYPNVNLRYQYIGGTNIGEQFTWISTNLAAGTLPDIVMMYFPGPDIYNAFDLVYDLSDELQQPNPYSDNATWYDDFPLDALVIEQLRAEDGGYRVVGPTQSGDTGVTVYVYNKTIFDEVGVSVPTTWGEFMTMQAELQEAGVTPFFMPMAGPLGWLWGWSEVIIREQLLQDVIEECDFEAPFNTLNDKEMAYCVKTGRLTLEDPRFAEAWYLMREWSQYWQSDFLAPPSEGDLFATGEVAMVNSMNLWIGQIADNPNIDFEWGTFYQPPVRPEDSQFGNDLQTRRMGNLGQAGSGSIYLFIPTTTLQRPERFELALDLARWATAPAQVDFWCSLQSIPCYQPGTPIEEVYDGDETMITQMRGFFEPGGFNNGVANLDWATIDRSLTDEYSRLFTEFMGGAITPEQAFAEFDRSLQRAVDRLIRSNPQWEAENWE